MPAGILMFVEPSRVGISISCGIWSDSTDLEVFLLKLRRARRAVTLAGALIGVLAVLVVRGATAQGALLSEDDAVALAVRYAQTPAPAGMLASHPTAINAKLMTFGDAWQVKNGRPLEPLTRYGRDSGRSVWLVFLRGDVSVRRQALLGEGSVGSSTTYQQMSVVLDASSGELVSIAMHPPGREVAQAATLPAIAVPNTVRALPQVVHGPPEAPFPTRVPVTGPSGQEQVPPSVPGRPSQATATPVRPVS